jgi:hypothetical protein
MNASSIGGEVWKPIRMVTFQANVGGWTKWKCIFTGDSHYAKLSFKPHDMHEVDKKVTDITDYWGLESELICPRSRS